MALTREQYDEIMRILSGRRSAALAAQQRRQEEAETAVPALLTLREQIIGLSAREAMSRLHKNNEDPAILRQERKRLTEERNRLLWQSGFGPEVYEVRWTCPLCRDTGYVGNKKCGCMKRLESELLNRDAGLPALLEKENFSTFDLEVFDDEQPIRELLPDLVTQYAYMSDTVVPKVEEYIALFDTPGSHNILMIGPVGTGKTFMSNCIARELIDRQHTVLYEKAGDFFARLTREAFAREKNEAEEYRIARVESCELLILDDLGTEFITEFTRAQLFSLISNRLSRGLSTIISSNLSLNQISNAYGERIASRFIGEYTVLPFYGADLRLKATGGNET